MSIFARELTDNLASLVKQIDEQVAKHDDQKMAAYVVILAEDADEVAPQLEALAKKHDIKNVPLTIFDGESGPGNYRIAKEADVTVLMWKGLKVTSNHAYKKGELDEKSVQDVVAKTSTILK